MIQTQEHSFCAVSLHEHTHCTQFIKSHTHDMSQVYWTNHDEKKRKKKTTATVHSGNVSVSTRQGSTNTSQKPWVQKKKKKKRAISHRSSYQSSSPKLPSSASGTWLLGKKSAYCSTLLLPCSGNCSVFFLRKIWKLFKRTVVEALVSGVAERIQPSGIN